jgi:TolA-binding protein
MLERGKSPARHADWEKRYFFLLGWVQENYLHDYDKALAAYRRVYINYKQAFDYNDDAMMFSARLLSRTGKTAEAQRLYQDLITNYPQDFWTQDAQNELSRLQSGEKPGSDWPVKMWD